MLSLCRLRKAAHTLHRAVRTTWAAGPYASEVAWELSLGDDLTLFEREIDPGVTTWRAFLSERPHPLLAVVLREVADLAEVRVALRRCRRLLDTVEPGVPGVASYGVTFERICDAEWLVDRRPDISYHWSRQVYWNDELVGVEHPCRLRVRPVDLELVEEMARAVTLDLDELPALVLPVEPTKAAYRARTRGPDRRRVMRGDEAADRDGRSVSARPPAQESRENF